jgi:hypothetical protein
MAERRRISPKTKATVWARTRGRCWYCGVDTNPFDDFCIDHVVPLVRGGTDSVDNLAPCCRSCNAIKGIRLTDEWDVHAERDWDRAFAWLEEGKGSLWFEGDEAAMVIDLFDVDAAIRRRRKERDAEATLGVSAPRFRRPEDER